jgi:hypothetical protein
MEQSIFAYATPRGLAIVSNVVALSVCLSACASSAPLARLWEYPAGAGGVVAVNESTAGQQYSFDDITLCLTTKGEVDVTSVVPIDATGGLEVHDFGVLPANTGGAINYIEDPSASLSEAGFDLRNPSAVAAVCPDLATGDVGGGLYVLGISVSRTDRDVGTARGFRVTYQSGGGEYSADYPLGVALCRDLYTPSGDINPECDVHPITMPSSEE